jgi:hypothetical protein
MNKQKLKLTGIKSIQTIENKMLDVIKALPPDLEFDNRLVDYLIRKIAESRFKQTKEYIEDLKISHLWRRKNGTHL